MRRPIAFVGLGILALVLGAAACSHGSTLGHIKCTSKSSIDAGGACTISYSDCADNKRYEVTCGADVCACTVDGMSNGTKGLSDCPGDSGEMNFDCGFDITE